MPIREFFHLMHIVADIEAVEPLGRNAAGERKRLVRLDLDEEAREKIAPGISDLVKGKVSVSLDVAKNSRKVEADLTAAELWIPWTGWTKGAGVPAEVSFLVDTSAGGWVTADVGVLLTIGSGLGLA